MYGLAVRWSLVGVPPAVVDEVVAYVRSTSYSRFSGRPGLRWKSWTVQPGVAFAGDYVWATAEARAEFVAWFRANPSPVTSLLGHGPEAIEEFAVVAVAEGAEGFLAAVSP